MSTEVRAARCVVTSPSCESLRDVVGRALVWSPFFSQASQSVRHDIASIRRSDGNKTDLQREQKRLSGRFLAPGGKSLRLSTIYRRFKAVGEE